MKKFLIKSLITVSLLMISIPLVLANGSISLGTKTNSVQCSEDCMSNCYATAAYNDTNKNCHCLNYDPSLAKIRVKCAEKFSKK